MGTFAKRYELHELEDELTKARLLYECSVDGSFSAPAVVSSSAESGVVDYETVDCSRSLMDALGDKDRSRESIMSLLSAVGKCLAEIHQMERPVRSVEFQRSQLFADSLAVRVGTDRGSGDLQSGQTVLQHCDFGFTNIFVGDSDELIVIDPSPNHYISVHALNLDYPELDLSILVSHLVGRASNPVALGRSALFGRAMVDAVVEGYEAAGSHIDRDRLRLYTQAGIDAVRQFASAGSQAHRRAILKPISAVLARNI